MEGAPKDTETLIRDFKVPQVYPQVVCRHVGLVVAVDGYGVDVVCVSVGEHPPGSSLHHQVHGPEHGHLRGGKQSISTGHGAAAGTLLIALSPKKNSDFVRTEGKANTKAFYFWKAAGGVATFW